MRPASPLLIYIVRRVDLSILRQSPPFAHSCPRKVWDKSRKNETYLITWNFRDTFILRISRFSKHREIKWREK